MEFIAPQPLKYCTFYVSVFTHSLQAKLHGKHLLCEKSAAEYTMSYLLFRSYYTFYCNTETKQRAPTINLLHNLSATVYHQFNRPLIISGLITDANKTAWGHLGSVDLLRCHGDKTGSAVASRLLWKNKHVVDYTDLVAPLVRHHWSITEQLSSVYLSTL